MAQNTELKMKEVEQETEFKNQCNHKETSPKLDPSLSLTVRVPMSRSHPGFTQEATPTKTNHC